MGWERRGGRTYYYVKERDGDRVRSRYVGNPLRAQILSEFVANETEFRQARAIANRCEREIFDTEDREMTHYFRTVDRIVREILEASGFHRQDRGRWRKRRG